MFLKMIKKFKLIIFLVFSFSINADNSVSTSSGIAEAKLEKRVLIWSDIPYAQAPIGDLRWKAPRAIINANANIQPKENNFCIQKTSSLGGSSQFSEKIISGTEDCLYLDIFAPKNSVDKKLPVMFWIHGGGNTWGYSASPMHIPTNF